MSFEAFPKIARLNRDCVITEKIDGTNAQVEIIDPAAGDFNVAGIIAESVNGLLMFAGSRTRYITPEDDNFGFAGWVKANADALFTLGPGRHYGEWWGGKIQRGYGQKDKRFSLFNTGRWNTDNTPMCCDIVPVLYEGRFSTGIVDQMIDTLRVQGSVAAPGFMRPEGVVVFMAATRTMFKVTLEGDSEGKEQKARREKFAA